jgi:hypothetical protein
MPIRGTEEENFKDRSADELRKAAHKGGFVSPHLFPLCQLPDTVTDVRGNVVRKPATWT